MDLIPSVSKRARNLDFLNKIPCFVKHSTSQTIIFIHCLRAYVTEICVGFNSKLGTYLHFFFKSISWVRCLKFSVSITNSLNLLFTFLSGIYYSLDSDVPCSFPVFTLLFAPLSMPFVQIFAWLAPSQTAGLGSGRPSLTTIHSGLSLQHTESHRPVGRPVHIFQGSDVGSRSRGGR